MTAYYDARNEQHVYTVAELTAICAGELKPYPDMWYETADELLEYRYMNLRDEWDALCQDPDACDDMTRHDWARYSCLVNKWQNLKMSLSDRPTRLYLTREQLDAAEWL